MQDNGRGRHGWKHGTVWLLGGLLALAAAVLLRWPPAILAVDLNQTRLDRAMPAFSPTHTLQQTFVPRQDGLREVEILLAKPDRDDETGTFTLSLWDDTQTVVARESWSAANLSHNQSLVLRLPRQPHSANHTYTLTLQGDETNTVSAWAYSLNVIERGQLQWTDGSRPDAAALRLVTRYQLGWGQALAWLGQTLWQEGGLLVLTVAFLGLPGGLLLPLFPPARRWDRAAWWGISLALGAATWPLLWFWLSLVGGRWRGWSLWLVLLAGWGVILLRARHVARKSGVQNKRDAAAHGTLILLLLLALSLRLLAVRDLAFPPWVDASRHALITEVMVAGGRFPTNYGALLPVARAPYHYGFHAIAASLDLMGGWTLPAFLLYLGQWLNSIIPLVIYAATWLVTRHRGGSLAAAFLVAVPFFFPAYYATWGRFTQLTALLILPALLALTWQILRGGRHWRGGWWPVGMLSAGIFLIHIRVFLLYLPFAALAWLASHARRTRSLAAAALLALTLTLPRWIQLWQFNQGKQLTSAIAGYNAFPIGYVQAGWERWFLVFAGIGLLYTFYAAWRRRPWAALPITLGLWVTTTLLLISGRLPGIPSSWLVNLNSAYITLFIPLAWLFGLLLWRAARWLRRQRPAAQNAARLLAGGLLVVLLLFGGHQQITILNEQTLLANPADAAALQWLDANIPATAKVAVNSWRWLGSTWAASDGGAWILPLTGRQTTTPPVDYIYDPTLARQVSAFNESAAQMADWSTPAAADWLRQQGVTHIFVGVKGGFFNPATLRRNPRLTLLYSQGGAFIFAVDPNPVSPPLKSGATPRNRVF
ncbi:MAG: hypothetical protein KC418_01980 [Anaerolineales bacterium]|nr:hypothetical protein [Anaerolineales bacterium]MCB8950967.1 hypothetical protein [Ardenticatenales bacterium]